MSDIEFAIECLECGNIDNDLARETAISALRGAEKYEKVERAIQDLRNFACQLCGKYKKAHEGDCDGCKWQIMNFE